MASEARASLRIRLVAVKRAHRRCVGLAVSGALALLTSACSTGALGGDVPQAMKPLLAAWHDLGLECGDPKVGMPENAPEWHCSGAVGDIAPPNGEVLRRTLVEIGGVFFLRDKGVSAAMAGQPESRQRIESDFYRVVCSNGWLLPQGDSMILPLAWEDSALVSELAGRSPTDVIETIEAQQE